MVGAHQSYDFFQTLLHHQNQCPFHGGAPTPHLKMKSLHLKNKPPLKSKAPFQETIPRKNTINNNLKFS